MTTNNVTRLLEAANARYQIFELAVEKISAAETADVLNVSPEVVYKTIVVIPPKGKPALCVVSGVQRVDLKKVAAILREKKVRVATQLEAESITGLQTGGISPLALINKGFKTILDASVEDYEQIHISGGQRGLNLRIHVEDLKRMLDPIIAEISNPILQEHT